MSSNVPSCDSKDCFMCKLENQNIVENFKMVPKKKFSTSNHLIVINILIVIVIILFILNVACNGSVKF